MKRATLGDEFELGTYNALATVEEADAIVRTDSQLDELLEAASEVVVSHGMEARFGVGLLHKHSICLPGERMIEFAEPVGGREALVTRPVASDGPGRDAHPTIWQVQEHGFVPLEFSMEPRAGALLMEGEVPDDFLEEFRQLTARSPIGRYVGLAVVERDLYASAGANEVAVEYSNDRDRSNVVVLGDLHDLKGKTIETAWTFEQRVDPRLGCIKRCRKTCWSVEGGHRPNHEHLHATSED